MYVHLSLVSLRLCHFGQDRCDHAHAVCKSQASQVCMTMMSECSAKCRIQTVHAFSTVYTVTRSLHDCTEIRVDYY